MKFVGNLLFVLALMFGGVLVGYSFRDNQVRQLKQCFNSCASLVLLTPDDPDVYKSELKLVEQCADQE